MKITLSLLALLGAASAGDYGYSYEPKYPTYEAPPPSTTPKVSHFSHRCSTDNLIFPDNDALHPPFGKR
jgi:hypothetical protein